MFVHFTTHLGSSVHVNIMRVPANCETGVVTCIVYMFVKFTTVIDLMLL